MDRQHKEVLLFPSNVLYLSYFKLQFITTITTIMQKFILLLAEGLLQILWKTKWRQNQQKFKNVPD